MMAQEITKVRLNPFEDADERLPSECKPSELLRRTKVKQCTGSIYNSEQDAYCAIGALLYELGYDAKKGDFDNMTNTASELLVCLTKIPEAKTAPIWQANDRDHLSFTQIADRLEEWGY